MFFDAANLINDAFSQLSYTLFFDLLSANYQNKKLKI